MNDGKAKIAATLSYCLHQVKEHFSIRKIIPFLNNYLSRKVGRGRPAVIHSLRWQYLILISFL